MAGILLLLLLSFVSFIAFIVNLIKWLTKDKNKSGNKILMMIFLVLTIFFAFIGLSMLGEIGRGMAL